MLGYVSDNISLSLLQSTFVEFFNSPLCSAVCKKLSSPRTYMIFFLTVGTACTVILLICPCSKKHQGIWFKNICKGKDM